jgi:hypothetical protein
MYDTMMKANNNFVMLDGSMNDDSAFDLTGSSQRKNGSSKQDFNSSAEEQKWLGERVQEALVKSHSMRLLEMKKGTTEPTSCDNDGTSRRAMTRRHSLTGVKQSSSRGLLAMGKLKETFNNTLHKTTSVIKRSLLSDEPPQVGPPSYSCSMLDKSVTGHRRGLERSRTLDSSVPGIRRGASSRTLDSNNKRGDGGSKRNLLSKQMGTLTLADQIQEADAADAVDSCKNRIENGRLRRSRRDNNDRNREKRSSSSSRLLSNNSRRLEYDQNLAKKKDDPESNKQILPPSTRLKTAKLLRKGSSSRDLSESTSKAAPSMRRTSSRDLNISANEKPATTKSSRRTASRDDNNNGTTSLKSSPKDLSTSTGDNMVATRKARRATSRDSNGTTSLNRASSSRGISISASENAVASRKLRRTASRDSTTSLNHASCSKGLSIKASENAVISRKLRRTVSHGTSINRNRASSSEEPKIDATESPVNQAPRRSKRRSSKQMAQQSLKNKNALTNKPTSTVLSSPEHRKKEFNAEGVATGTTVNSTTRRKSKNQTNSARPTMKKARSHSDVTTNELEATPWDVSRGSDNSSPSGPKRNRAVGASKRQTIRKSKSQSALNLKPPSFSAKGPGTSRVSKNKANSTPDASARTPMVEKLGLDDQDVGQLLSPSSPSKPLPSKAPVLEGTMSLDALLQDGRSIDDVFNDIGRLKVSAKKGRTSLSAIIQDSITRPAKTSTEPDDFQIALNGLIGGLETPESSAHGISLEALVRGLGLPTSTAAVSEGQLFTDFPYEEWATSESSHAEESKDSTEVEEGAAILKQCSLIPDLDPEIEGDLSLDALIQELRHEATTHSAKSVDEDSTIASMAGVSMEMSFSASRAGDDSFQQVETLHTRNVTISSLAKADSPIARAVFP